MDAGCWCYMGLHGATLLTTGNPDRQASRLLLAGLLVLHGATAGWLSWDRSGSILTVKTYGFCQKFPENVNFTKSFWGSGSYLLIKNMQSVEAPPRRQWQTSTSSLSNPPEPLQLEAVWGIKQNRAVSLFVTWIICFVWATSASVHGLRFGFYFASIHLEE